MVFLQRFFHSEQHCFLLEQTVFNVLQIFLVNGISSSTCFYEWLSISLCMFSSCTFLYEWLSISFEWVFVMHISVRMTIHFFLNGMLSFLISVRMTTISFWIDCLHLHFRTNYYHFFLNGFSSFTFLYGCLHSHFEWISFIYIFVRMTNFSFLMDFLHLHSNTNDCLLFLNRFLSFIFLYE